MSRLVPHHAESVGTRYTFCFGEIGWGYPIKGFLIMISWYKIEYVSYANGNSEVVMPSITFGST